MSPRPARSGLDPASLRPWIRIIRDLLLALVGVFILLHETLVTSDSPRPFLIGAALTMLGAPQVLRLTRSEE